MKLHKILMVAGIGATLMLSSCYDLDRNPDYQVSSGTFFQTEEHAKQAMMGTYSIMRSDNVYGLFFGWDCLGGISRGYDNPSFQTIQRGTVSVTNSWFSNKWSACYEGIARSNNVLQNIDNVDMSEELKNRYRGEARFMRGLYYFHLLSFFGGVPIYDESWIVGEKYAEMLLPRNTEDEVRAFILDDFTAAAAVLPASWDAANYGRATSGAAIALKGRVLLFAKRYQEASQCFSQVINSGEYQLYPNYPDLFTPTGDQSSEMVFAIQNQGGTGQEYGMPMCFYLGSRSSFGSCWNNVEAATTFVDEFEWADGRPFDWEEVFPGYTTDSNLRKKIWFSELNSAKNAVIEYTPYKEQLLEMYDKRDPRMQQQIILPYTHYIGWSKAKATDHEYVLADGMGIPADYGMIRTNDNNDVYLWRKFVPEGDMNGGITNRSHTPINYAIVRYADVLLMQAECLNELGDQAGAVALVNQVRARSNMPGINSGPSWLAANSHDEVFDRIKHERRIELACEGHSYFDMKRWGLLETLNGVSERTVSLSKSTYTRKVTERDYYWPIPSGEIDKNESLTQNPGW